MASFQVTKPLILMALPQESQGRFEAENVKVHYTGVGKIKATFAALNLVEQLKPEWVINLGTAGSKKLQPGQLVECSHFIQRDPFFAQFPQKIFETHTLSNLPQVTCGSADSIEYGDRKIECDIFDMEAYALAYVCDQKNIKFNSFKYITDASNEDTITDWKKNLNAASSALFEQYKKIIG